MSPVDLLKRCSSGEELVEEKIKKKKKKVARDW